MTASTLRSVATCLFVVAWPVASSALTIIFDGRVVGVPSDTQLRDFYLEQNGPPADPADYLFDRPAIGTTAPVKVFIGDRVLKRALEVGSGTWNVSRQDFYVNLFIETYVSSNVFPSPYYEYRNTLGRFSLSYDDGTKYLRPWPDVYTNRPDGGIDVVTFQYPVSGQAPATFRQLSDYLRQPLTTGVYHADLGNIDTGLYLDVAITSPRVVPLPATVWLCLSGLGAMFAARRRLRGP